MPTFLNTSFDFDSLSVSDLVMDGNWDPPKDEMPL